MYLHFVKNPTNKTRVVLYLDVKRINLGSTLNNVIHFGNFYIENSYVLQSFIKNQHMQIKDDE